MSTSSAASEPERSTSGSSPTPEIIFQQPATGNFWTDAKTAFKSLTFGGPFRLIESVPCARNSLLTGIASGAGVGVIRAMSAGAFVASNWAVGTFMVISIGSWHICQWNMAEEHRRIQTVVEQLPKRLVKKDSAEDAAGIEAKSKPVTRP